MIIKSNSNEGLDLGGWQQEQLSRREFCEQAARFVGAVGVGTLAGDALFSPGTAEAQAGKEHAEVNPENFPQFLDAATASAVAGAFAYHVFYRGVRQGVPLGFKSAAAVNGLAFARIGALKLTGNPEAGELADEELHEIKESMLLVPALVAISDITTSELKVDVEEMFGQLFPNLTIESEKYKKPKRPRLGDDIEKWQSYLEEVNKDLTNKVAEVTAVSSVLAPLATTYPSSALANRMKGEVCHILYEQSFAIEVIQGKNQNGSELIDRDAVQQRAIERTDKYFNGPLGFSNLLLTLSANFNGALGLGDPPELFAIARHLDKPDVLLKANAFGAAISELSTLLFSKIWLNQVEANQPFTGTFLAKQVETWNSVFGTLSRLKDVSFNDGRKAAKQLQAVLAQSGEEDNEETIRALTAIAKGIPPARLQLSLRKYLERKVKWVKRFSATAEELNIHRLEGLDTQEFAQDLMNGGFKERRQAMGILKAVYEQSQDEKSTELAELIAGMVEESSISEVGVSEREIDVTPGVDGVDEQDVVGKFRAAKRILKEFEGASDGEAQSRMTDFKDMAAVLFRQKKITRRAFFLLFGGKSERGSTEPLTDEEIRSALAQADETTLRRAVQKLVDIDFKDGVEDVIPGYEQVLELGEAVKNAPKQHDSEIHFLSHSATEVAGALGTQIPAVPAIKRSSNLTIKPVVDGILKTILPQVASENPEIGLILSVVAVMIAEIGTSAFADNVAAYLYAEGGIMDQVKEQFGKDVFERYPDLEGWIITLSLKLAETAGALSKYGNGPNFSQEKCVVLVDETNAQGISIDRVELPVGDTLKNGYAALGNALLVTVSGAIIGSKIKKIASLEKMAA